MAYQDILYDVADGILTVTLNRPDKLNAFTRVMGEELRDAFDRADADDAVRAVIITGAGRGFCAGADLSRGGDTFNYDKRGAGEVADPRRDGGGLLTLRIFDCKKPVIAAVNGPAVGIGATMLLPMDVRIAAAEARFGFVFARRGVVPEACSSWFLPRLVGIGQALEWMMSGRVFPAAEAQAGGLVRDVYPADELLAQARRIARGFIDETSAVSVAMCRQMLWKMLTVDHPMEAHKVDSRGMRAMGRAADAREGIASFLEKRAPNFTMKPSTDMPDVYPWWAERTFE